MNLTEMAKEFDASLMALEKRLSALESAVSCTHNVTINDAIPIAESIQDSKAAAKLVMEEFRDLDHEEFWAAYLDADKKPLKKEMVGMGNFKEVTIDTKRIIRNAVLAGAKSVLVYHNHPSGYLIPSMADINMTRELKQGLDFLGLKLTDHLILCGNRFFSFVEEKTMKC